MLAKEHRFHGYNSLRAVYRQGSTVRNQHISIKYALNGRRQTYRAAVVVSRKVNNSAVGRNRIRRRLYEVIRGSEVSITQPYDIVLTVFSEQVADTPPEKLRHEVLGLLKKAGILQPAVQPPRQSAIVEKETESL